MVTENAQIVESSDETVGEESRESFERRILLLQERVQELEAIVQANSMDAHAWRRRNNA